MKRSLTIVAVVLGLLAEVAGAATTRIDEHGTVLVDGRKVLPIVLAKGPEGSGVDLGGRRIIKEKNAPHWQYVRLVRQRLSSWAPTRSGSQTRSFASLRMTTRSG